MEIMSKSLPIVVGTLVLLGCCDALPARIHPGDRRIYVDGKPLHIKGVNWNPVPVGKTHPHGLEFAEHVEGDARIMAEAGVNVIRTYEPITDLAVLDTLWKNGIQVLNTVFAHGAKRLDAVAREVNAVKHHPAILMWVAGNEWNYNGCYQQLDLYDCGQRVNEAAKVIKQHDLQHPVASIYGEAPPADVIQRLDHVDVWGINYYDELSFGDLFKRWAERSTKPLFIGEYGADAYDSNIHGVNEEAQAEATRILTEQIMENSAVWESGVCSGGLVFELADEWWKDGHGSLHVQDVGGIAPGGGPHPDRTFNEEWWGLLTLGRQPRKAYYAFAALAIPQPHLTASLLAVGGNATEGVRKSCTFQGCTLVPRAREEFCPRQGCGKATVMNMKQVP
eukprot:gb/GFBE01009114.1/.p1 GENE.gb/GFBE01009114.1/~~gb/GFBE01009114.1/.p1  ORF type:complete len:392 (+),score=66.52 gb/GFBE01009114.1/:1-1176(+)